jgi:predicted RNase H-like HicB family nuclease
MFFGTPGNQFDVITERDSQGYYIASVPQLRGCHTQANSLDAVVERIREAVVLCLEVESGPSPELEFVGIQRITVAVRAKGCGSWEVTRSRAWPRRFR